jgi:hypothetical protein
MVNKVMALISCNSINIDNTPKRVLLCAFLLASDRIVISLCYNILKKHQIPLDICTKPLPEKIWTWFDQISKKQAQVSSTISSKIQLATEYLFPSFQQLYQRPLTRILIGPVCEEFFCRMVLQELFLRQIPRLILAEKGHFLELKIAKVFRIILSSTIFALLHTDLWGKGFFVKAGINSQFIGGITYGIMTEQTHGIMYSTLMHIFHNLSVGSTGN